MHLEVIWSVMGCSKRYELTGKITEALGAREEKNPACVLDTSLW